MFITVNVDRKNIIGTYVGYYVVVGKNYVA